MQSSYRVIKNNFAKISDSRLITTEYANKEHTQNKQEEIFEQFEEEANISEDAVTQETIDPEELLKRYEQIGQRIVNEAEEQKNKLLLDSQIEVSRLEKEAYDKGYKQGQENGYEDGYKKAHDETIEEAKKEADEMIKHAEIILNSAQSQYSDYLEAKKKEVVDLAFSIATNIIKKELNDNDELINDIIEEAFKLSKGEESVIVKVNPEHVSEVQRNCERWKLSYDIKKEIFVLADKDMNVGNAILEKPSGIVKIGIDTGMELLKNALF